VRLLRFHRSKSSLSKSSFDMFMIRFFWSMYSCASGGITIFSTSLITTFGTMGRACRGRRLSNFRFQRSIALAASQATRSLSDRICLRSTNCTSASDSRFISFSAMS
jgi:hypothetical protein